MIVPMKKVYLVMLERDRAEGLVRLREFGLVHLETGAPAGDAFDRARKDRDTLMAALSIVPAPKKTGAGDTIPTSAAVEMAEKMVALDAKAKGLREEAAALGKEIDRAAPWGDFTPADLESLRSDGVEIALYECDPRNLPDLPEEAETLILQRSRKVVRFAVIGRREPSPVLSQSFIPFAPPADSPAALRAKLDAVGAELARTGTAISEGAHLVPAFKEAIRAMDQEIALATVDASFDGEGQVVHLKGYIPAADAPALAELARVRGWGLLSDDPVAEDAPPTKVRNNAVVRMIDPVFAFLGIVPGYREYEISNWFLLFFSLFVAMIFGDGGYGVLMLAASLAMALSAKSKGKPVSDGNRLFLVLSVTTLLWGAATGTWFALPADSLPGWLRGISLHALAGDNPESSKNIRVFCFIIGTLQLSVARLKNIRRDFPNLKFLGQFGSLAMIWGMMFFVLALVVDSARFPAPPYAVWLVLGGFALNFVFGAYDGNILKSALEGAKNIIPNFLGAVGVFADIVSYIRLWAVGMAGASLAAIINDMGGGMMGTILMAFAGVVLLVVGHALNLVLSVLSVIVHGVRLNILEFSNHLGMEWSGTRYDPFRVTYREETAE